MTRIRSLSWLGGLAAALTITLASTSVADAQGKSEDGYIHYVMKPGDTLIGLAANFLIDGNYKPVADLNQVRDPRRIPTGTVILFPPQLLKTEPIVGQISAFRGDVTVDGQPVSLGTTITQGMKVETGANAFVTVGLPDGSSISLPSQSRISVSKLRRFLLTGALDRTFRLQEGRARSSVTPVRDPDSNFRVTTPLSVAAVRGTDFRIGFDPKDGRALTEVVGGTVGVQADADKQATAVPKGFGVISTATGTQQPVALLAAPELIHVQRSGAAGGVLITFKPVDGAKKYHVQLATDVNFTNVFDEQTTDQQSATFTITQPFFLRLTAIADTGMEGLPATYSAERRVS